VKYQYYYDEKQKILALKYSLQDEKPDIKGDFIAHLCETLRTNNVSVETQYEDLLLTPTTGFRLQDKKARPGYYLFDQQKKAKRFAKLILTPGTDAKPEVILKSLEETAKQCSVQIESTKQDAFNELIYNDAKLETKSAINNQCSIM